MEDRTSFCDKCKQLYEKNEPEKTYYVCKRYGAYLIPSHKGIKKATCCNYHDRFKGEKYDERNER